MQNLFICESIDYTLQPGQRIERTWHLGESYGWYDLVVRSDAESGFVQRLAGHVETGAPGVSDPAMAQARWQNLGAL